MLTGSLRLRRWYSCGGGPGERRASIEFLELTNGSETIAHPRAPVTVALRRITAATGHLFRSTYYVREETPFATWWVLHEDDGASALLDQWVEPIDEEEAWLHEVWMKRDPDGESLIDWTGPDGLPAHLDLALRIEASVRHCHQPDGIGSFSCRFHEPARTVGSLRLIASVPEPKAAASTLAAIAALLALRRRADARARSDP